MSIPVFVGSAFVAGYPEGGGAFWVPLQWLLGLRAHGIDAWWLECLWTQGDPARDRARIAAFLRATARLGVGDRVALLYLPEGGRDDPPRRVEHLGLEAAGLEARARDGVLLNLAHGVTPPLRAGFARTALFDIDPGPFQIWARQVDLGVGRHDVHLTLGWNLGAADCPVALGGVRWERLWPAVHLEAWPDRAAEGAGGRWTTVTQWWNEQAAWDGDDCYDCSKRSGFLNVLELPARTGLPLELAVNLHPGEREDRALLLRHGWRLADPARVAGSPEDFRRYVQGSRGELSAAKPAYVKARSGWLSDRTVAYLASGRPCVVEDTGAGRHLPASPGLRFWRDLDEAVEALREVERDLPRAARAARELAEEVFSTRAQVPRLLAALGL